MPFADDRDTEKGYIELIGEIAGTLQYGSITIIIQDGKIVQIEKNEKIRVRN